MDKSPIEREERPRCSSYFVSEVEWGSFLREFLVTIYL